MLKFIKFIHKIKKVCINTWWKHQKNYLWNLLILRMQLSIPTIILIKTLINKISVLLDKSISVHDMVDLQFRIFPWVDVMSNYILPSLKDQQQVAVPYFSNMVAFKLRINNMLISKIFKIITFSQEYVRLMRKQCRKASHDIIYSK